MLEVERVGDRAGGADAERGQPPQVVLAEAPAHSGVALSTPNSRPPSVIGTCMNEPIRCVSTTQRTKRSSSSARGDVRLPGGRDAPDHALAEPEARAGEPLADAAAGDVAQLGRPGRSA